MSNTSTTLIPSTTLIASTAVGPCVGADRHAAQPTFVVRPDFFPHDSLPHDFFPHVPSVAPGRGESMT